MSDRKGPKIDLPAELAAEFVGDAAEGPEDAPVEQAAAAEADPGDGAELAADAAPSVEEAETPGDQEEAESPADQEEPETTPEQEIAQLKDRYLRMAAEFDNFKRRALKERQELLNFGAEGLIKELLPTIDNLERALGYVGAEEGEAVDKENLAEGVELTFRSLMQTLEKAGVEVVDPLDQPFDPRLHEAMRQVPSADHSPGTVLEVYQKGYLLRKRLLRPALVAVSGAAQHQPEDD